jgi:hypothetical protein
MRPIPIKIRKELANDPFMQKCIYENCQGSPEWEHAFIYAGRQINESWAIVPVCSYHHRGAGLDKEYNQFHSILRATEEDFRKYPRFDWQRLKKYLIKKYGKQ